MEQVPFSYSVLDPETGCWLWQRGKDRNGYPQVVIDGRYRLAHRWAYEHLVGPIPDGLQLDHVVERGCRHRHCINPAHLEPVTARENVLRSNGVAARKAAQTECIWGHPFDEANTYVDSRGRRHCRACKRERAAARA